jgi:mono/diheme cytochrome c family protein
MLRLSHPFRQSTATSLAAYSLALSFLVTGLVIAGVGRTAVAQKPAATGKAKQGETIFKAQCIGCHNKQPGDTAPFGPPNLHGIIGSTAPQITPQVAAATIKTGKGIMPPFEGKLTAQDISSVVAYLKTQ